MSKQRLKSFVNLGIISLVISIVLSGNQVKAETWGAKRTSGSDRYATAAQVAIVNWTTSKNVVLVSGEGYADAVSASVLAKKLNSPILLTTSKELNQNTSSALTSLGAENIYVIGGTASVSLNVRNKLKSKYNLIELGGKDRYETNLAVASELVNLGVNPGNVMLVSGEGFSDALSAAPIASVKEEIILLTNNDKNCMEKAINFVKVNNSKVTVIGTPNVVSREIFSAFNSILRVDGGADRFDTNLKIISFFSNALNFEKIYVVNANNDGYADALVASVLAGKSGAPLVLLSDKGSTATYNAIHYFIKDKLRSISNLNVIGGPGVIPDDIIDEIDRSLPIAI